MVLVLGLLQKRLNIFETKQTGVRRWIDNLLFFYRSWADIIESTYCRDHYDEEVLNQEQRKAFYEHFLALDTDTWDVRVRREKAEPGTTFSLDVMNKVMDVIKLFVGARLIRQLEDTGTAPHTLSVKVSVEAR